ncbi:Glutamate receptor-like protein [Quillaja saponaria]|uniref:Glutamate receptor-like protein n=1 Tax=Quillaja saponaria TaxID=32244 RepID=A0AAD7QDH9_QUISA|nr:Glutamate receptor-like protein [Quillaja saponaria]
MADQSCYSCLLSSLVLFMILGSSSASSSVGAATPMEPIKLTIGVPKKDGFTQFVKVKWNTHTNKYDVTGFCIDVFNAVANALPFKISAEFEPYVDEAGNSAGSYGDLLQEIPKKKYNVVVGDVTIVAERATYVDFTLPFTETGVRMLVRVQHGRHKSMWSFARPFSWDLWLSIVIFSVFIGIVIRIMERNATRSEIDSSSSSPILHREQLTMVSILWLPLSQMVIPQRELVAKNCSRFVLVVWLLLAFVLMQSYTASLSSILTLDQLQPSYLSVQELITKGHKVGYQSGSFVRNQLLVQRLKFDPSNVIPYGSISEYNHALRNGTIAAIFDEIPYIKVFLNKFGSRYMMVGPTYRTGGLGFAFAYNSSLTSYFSRAILSVIESDTMDTIEDKYFGSNNGVLQDQDQSGGLSSDSPSPSLAAHSFAGLFMITGIATLLALLVSETVIWQKPVVMAKAYSQKYLFSPKRSKKINAADFSTDGSITTRGRVGSTDEAKVEEELHDLENPSSTLHNNEASDKRNASSDGISLAVEI